MMRVRPRSVARLIAFVALSMAAACDSRAPASPEPNAGFTLEVFAHEGDQIYLVRHSDGRRAAARVENGASAIMDGGQAQTLLDERVSTLREPEKADVSIRAPGFSLQVAEDGENERARIEINAGGKQVLIDAEGEGEADRAHVQIAGADEEAARDFIKDADELSEDTKTQMLRALRL
jgi:hypothetical protein